MGGRRAHTGPPLTLPLHDLVAAATAGTRRDGNGTVRGDGTVEGEPNGWGRWRGSVNVDTRRGGGAAEEGAGSGREARGRGSEVGGRRRR